MARQPTRPSLLKTEQLQIRLTAGEKAELKSRAERSGVDVSTYVLRRALPPTATAFRDICHRLQHAGDKRSFVLAELNELLTTLRGNHLDDAVAEPPVAKLEPFEAAYVAALVEQATVLRGLPPPSWTAAVPPLPEPWFGTSLLSLRLHLLTASPPPFLRRNIFIDSAIGGRI